MLIISGLSFPVSLGASVHFPHVLGTLWHRSDCHDDIALCDLFLLSVVQLLKDIRKFHQVQ